MKIFNHFNLTTLNKLTLSDAKIAFDFCIKYCKDRPNYRSKWKGLLVGADHFASGLGYDCLIKIDNLFTQPNIAPFHNRKNKKFPLSLKKINRTHKHSITIAPTSAGKTDFLMRQCSSRIFYTLPFQASLNAMYQRFQEFLPKQDIRILHASSKLAVEKTEDIHQ